MPKPLKKLIDFLGSFGLAVTLLGILFLLTWFGTLEQVEHGLYPVQRKYFESWFVVHHVGPVPILLPGGMKVMILFAINLLIGGIIRMRMSWRNLGVLIAHLGMALLMVAGAVKQVASEDGLMKLRPGQQKSEFSSPVHYEVAIWDATSKIGPYTEFRIDPDFVRSVEDGGTRVFETPELPFEVVLSNYEKHSRVVPAAGIGVPDYPVIDGWTVQATKPKEVDDPIEPSVYATINLPDGRQEKVILFGLSRAAWSFEIGDRTWALALRREIYDLPFELRLDEFRQESHPGMRLARAFESDITRIAPDMPERQVLVQMNQPLREGPYVAYQAQWATDPDGVEATILQIVKNPSDQWPKYACYIIGVGLLLAFGHRLFLYLRREMRRRAKEAHA